ncbi:Sporulation related domain-containing protein [Epibacterium ulvae]|uniref:Sporulation related domain-containing protein n=1 Tax=Epibacterium ulvae TaxID=1156985 RepID=A0A1G5RI66_9RHOB|nr:SPOR domain-containing protein [Epibacterium ulvae]SCZ73737.1 Sporulation related domain-containing protein [Epibacterium ulvae]
MTFFTQAGKNPTSSESGFRQGDAAAGLQSGQTQVYSGPGTETYAQSAYSSDLPYSASPDDFQQSQGYQPPAPGRDWTKSLGIVGGIASLALVVGLGVWGYKLIVRDVSGVPVVRAIEGPMRIAPETPGGQQANNQGLAVNAVAAFGSAEEPADRLTLAPEAIELTEDDKTFAELRQVETLATPQTLELETAQVRQEPEAVRLTEGFRNGDIDSLVAEIAQESGVFATETRVAALVPAQINDSPLRDIEPVIATVPLDAPGVRVSLRPNLRPAGLLRSANAVQPQPVSAIAATALDVDPNSLPVGTRLAQIGAHASEDIAHAEWVRISGKFQDYFAGKQRVIQRTEKGGRPVYRLRVMGFADLSDARRFCSLLVSGNEACIPATTR